MFHAPGQGPLVACQPLPSCCSLSWQRMGVTASLPALVTPRACGKISPRFQPSFMLEVAVGGSSTWFRPPTWETQMDPEAPGFHLAQPQLLWDLKNNLFQIKVDTKEIRGGCSSIHRSVLFGQLNVRCGFSSGTQKCTLQNRQHL